MSKFSQFTIKKLYFKPSFNNISINRGPLFSQINFDHADIFFLGGGGGGCPEGRWQGGFFQVYVFFRVYVLETFRLKEWLIKTVVGEAPNGSSALWTGGPTGKVCKVVQQLQTFNRELQDSVSQWDSSRRPLGFLSADLMGY